MTVFALPAAHGSVAFQVTGSAHKRHQQHRPEAIRMSSSLLTIFCRTDARAYFISASEREHKTASPCASFLHVFPRASGAFFVALFVVFIDGFFALFCAPISDLFSARFCPSNSRPFSLFLCPFFQPCRTALFRAGETKNASRRFPREAAYFLQKSVKSVKPSPY